LNPAIGLPIAGYYQPKRAGRFHDRLYAKAVSLNCGGERVLIASLDLVGLAKYTCDEIRGEIEREHGIPRENVVLLSTHTHSGPETFSSNGSLSSLPPDVPMREELTANVEWMKRQILFALRMAMKEEEPVDHVSVSTASVGGLYSNRNEPARTIDTTLTTLRLGSVRPLLFVNHHCHPTVLGANNVAYSADFPAYLSGRLRSRLEAEQVNCVTGACGDVSTRLTLGNEFSKRRNLANVIKYGDALAALVVRSQRASRTVKDVAVGARSKALELRVKRHPDSAESERIQRDLEKGVRDAANATERSRMELALEGIKLWQETLVTTRGGLPARMDFDLGVVTLGDEFALVWASGELLSATGLMLKSASRFGTTMISGYGNGDVGYIPPRKAYENLEYEAVVTPLQEGETDLIERELLALVRG
jgi:hypothetical protein